VALPYYMAFWRRIKRLLLHARAATRITLKKRRPLWIARRTAALSAARALIARTYYRAARCLHMPLRGRYRGRQHRGIAICNAIFTTPARREGRAGGIFAAAARQTTLR